MAAKKSVYGSFPAQLINLNGNEAEDWKAIREATQGRLTHWGEKLLQEGLGEYVKSVLVEPLYICRDYRDLFSHFYSKKFLERSSYCSRLHFFGQADLTVDDIVLDPETNRQHYLGYSIVEPVRERSIGRTMLDPLKLGYGGNGFFCLRTKARVHILGADYEVLGFPYRSQSAEATVCAHAALWCACRYLSEKYSSYKELHPYDLIKMTGDNNGRRVPYRGMTYADYSTIFSEFGCHPAILRPRGTEKSPGGLRDWSRDPETFYDLYAYMESGFPILASFGGHVVNIIGHTLSDTIMPKHEPKEGFYNSAAFLAEYVVVDDNFFPYQRLAYQGGHQYYPDGAYSTPPVIDSVFAAVVPLPEKAYLRPADARCMAYAFLNNDTIRDFVEETRRELGVAGGPLVARQLLTSSTAFKRQKLECFRNQNDQLLTYPINLCLPHFVWITEISAVDLYGDRHCMGEVVLDATAGPPELEVVYARIGRYLVAGGQYQKMSNAHLSYPQYTHNLGKG